MDNRLLRVLARACYFLLAFIILAPLTQAQNQCSVIYTETNADSTFIPVDACTAVLDWEPPMVSLPSGSLCIIVNTTLFSVSGGYQMGDQVPAGTTVFITYRTSLINPLGGNQTVNFSFTIEFVDTLAPAFTTPIADLPQDITVDCLSDIPAAPTLTATDNCGAVMVLYDEGDQPTNCQGGSFVRTWTSTDATGNVLTHTQTITVNEDITPPTITQTPQNGISTCSDAANDYVDWLSSQRANLQATDDCGIMAVTDDAPDPASIQNYCGTITVTFSITDNCGLTTTSTATFTVDENEPPTLVATAQDININCTSGSSPLSDFNDWIANHGGAVAIDNCADVIWTTNPAIPTFPDLCTPPFNAVSVEFIASDGCGQSVSTTAIFTVQDNTPPTITTQAQDAIIDCAFRANIANLTGWLQSNGGAVVNDACTAPEEVVTTYIVNGTLMNTDEVLNAFIASEQLGCQDNVVIGGNLVNNVTGNITVTFSFADPCGNSTSTTATFATVDNTPPQLIAGAQGIVVQCNANIDSVLIEWLNRGASAVFNDECGSDIVFRTNPDADGIRTIIANAPDCGNTGFALVEFYASDMCGNENPTPTTATFTIQDDTGPTFDTPAQNDTIACAFNPGNNDAALQTWLAANGNAVATDFCGNITWNGYTWVANQGGIQVASGDNLNPPTAPDDICNWILEATFKVVDDCQNQSTTTASFVVGDVLAPTIVIPADVTVSCENIPTVPAVTITDNCDDVNTTDNLTFNQSEILDGSPTERCNYQILRTWITSDACGNMQNYTQIITVQDTLPPVFQNVADVTVSCADLSSVPFPVVTDACDTNPITPFAEEVSTQNADLSICEHYNYTITRTWTAMDACGNSRDTVQVITVTDNLPPTFTTPNDVTINCTQINDMNITGEPSGLSDNCSSQTINFTDTPQPPSGDCSQGYAIIRTWVATDICGNTYSDTQTLTIIDNEAPTVTNAASNQSLACDNTTDIATAFQTWVSNHAGATATDNCSDTLMWFAAVPGSYNLQDPSTFPGTPIGGLNVPVICPNPITGVTASETVDFVVYDRCNQAAVTTATFTVTDDVPPVIVQCPQDVTINGGGATCSGMYLVVPPTFVDDCGSQMVTQSFADIKPITSALPGDSETPVDMITLSFNNIPTTPIIATGNVVLNIVMEDIDAEESTEFFVIKAEDGTVLGQTTQATSQCAQTVITTILTITATQINSWAADSTIEFTLMPNIPANLEGRYAINDICAGARVVASLSYDSQESYGVQYQYSINNGTRTTVSPITTVAQSLSSGANTITYYLTDCAGNETSCTQTVTVEDNLAPTIVCPNNINVVLPQDECGSVSVTLPLPLSITDNCAFTSTYTQTQPSSLQQQYITYTYNPNILEYIADNKLITFTNLLPNATNDVTLTFFIEADVDSIGEYFTIIGENNTNLGTTEMGQSHIIAGNCSNALRATFTIPAATYNSWVGADGILSLNAISNLNLPVPPTYVGEGINPCTPSQVTFNGDTDGSNMYAVITYSEAQPYYYITGATTLPTTLLTTTPTHDFNVGVSTVHYLVQDAVGNADTCSFTVSVIDQQTPVAVCTPQTIFINPSGVVPYTLDGQLLDGGSTDNCGIVTWNANPNVFTCEQAGLVYNVTMTVTDAAGNTASCNTPVRVETALPQPTYTIGLCGSDSLSLFANPPSAPGNVYTYQWTGPGTFASNSPNPVIPNVNANHAGSYTVMITGITGCESAGTVEVSISGQPNTPSVSQSGTACQGGNVTLNTQSYGGNNVLYQWYQGVAPNGTFVANTITPQLILNNATVGSYQYYVIVTVDGCNSNPSASLAVTVTAPPTGTLSNAPVIDICEGNLVSLGATEGGVGYTYQWSGPNGFSHTVQYPPTFTATTPSSGTYTLVVSHNGCASPIVNTIVNVTDAPPQPTIAPDLPVCFGDTLVLNTNISNGILYTWTRNGIDTYQTVTNQLRIFPITAQDVGSWTVVVQQNNCNSPVSLPVNISPQQIPNVSTTPTITACAGTAVQLSATNITGANYTWRGPDGTFYFGANPTVQPPLVEGLYVVTVTSSNNCTATASTQVNIEAPPSIVTISVSNNSCVNGIDDVQLVPTVFPPSTGNYTYSWTHGGLGFSQDSIAVIANATSADSGPYILTVSNGANCISQPYTINTSFIDAPPVPTIPVSASGNLICAGDNISLSTNPVSGGATYQWSTPTGIVTTTNPSLQIPSSSSINSGIYFVQAVSVNGCLSGPSAELPITVITAQPPAIIVNNPVCEGDTLHLLVSPTYTGATYQWTGPNFTSNVPNPIIPNVTFSNQGRYQVIVSAGSCILPIAISDSVVVRARPLQPLVSGSSSVCVGGQNPNIDLNIIGNNLQGYTYIWYDAQTNLAVSPPTTDTTYTLNVSGYTIGQHSFYAIARDPNGCESVVSANWLVNFNQAPNETAFAGNDQQVCDDNANLSAAVVATGIGMWSSVNVGVQFVQPNQASTIVLNLHPGQNTLIWSLSIGGCGVYSQDSINVTYIPPATTTADTFNVDFGGTQTLTVLNNDTLPIGYNYILSIADSTQHGILSIVNNNEFFFRADATYKGLDSLVYKICSEQCPTDCVFGKVLLSIGTALGCDPPNIITPNGDGVNDAFIIPCIEAGKYPNVEVVIFNQWGDEVYRSKPYENNWQGTYQSSDLPIGTYFYVVDFGDASIKPKSGFLVIER